MAFHCCSALQMRLSLLVCALLCALAPGKVFAQGSTGGPLNLEASEISAGEVKNVEPLMTRDGQTIVPGLYRVAVTMNTKGQVQFVFSSTEPVKTTPPRGVLAKNNATASRKIYVDGDLVMNNLVKGIASLKGDFRLEPFSPTETVLSFTSKQFEARATLGRQKDSPVADLLPVSVELKESEECGKDCIQAFVVARIRNAGNSAAKGKWNVSVLDPVVYVGSVEDLAGGSETAVQSPNKIKFTASGQLIIDIKVYPDFYNKNVNDAKESNNSQRFSIKLNQ